MTNRISELFEACGVYLAPDNPEVARKEIDFFAEQIVRECVKILEESQGDTDFAIWKICQDFGIK